MNTATQRIGVFQRSLNFVNHGLDMRPSLRWVGALPAEQIGSPHSAVRRSSGRVTNYKDAEMALR